MQLHKYGDKYEILGLTEENVQTLVDMIYFGVVVHPDSRSSFLYELFKDASVMYKLTPNRQDFEGLIRFDKPGRLPGL